MRKNSISIPPPDEPVIPGGTGSPRHQLAIQDWQLKAQRVSLLWPTSAHFPTIAARPTAAGREIRKRTIARWIPARFLRLQYRRARLTTSS